MTRAGHPERISNSTFGTNSSSPASRSEERGRPRSGQGDLRKTQARVHGALEAHTRYAGKECTCMDTNYEEIRYEVEERPGPHHPVETEDAQRDDAPSPRRTRACSLGGGRRHCAVHCVLLRGRRRFRSARATISQRARREKGGPVYRTGRTHDDDIWLIEQKQSPDPHALGDAQAVHRPGPRELPGWRERTSPWLAIS